MNCTEFRHLLPETGEQGRSIAQESHLRSCVDCSHLVTDLDTIIREARGLQGSEEPSPGVWQSIRSEIKEIQGELTLIAREGRALQASEEPSPAVWQSIRREITEWQSDIDSVAMQARALQASDEPSPRVWNSIEIALRQEGLIRQPQRGSSRSVSWRRPLAWLVPVAASGLVALGLLVYGPVIHTGDKSSTQPTVFTPTTSVKVLDDDDGDLLQTVSSHTPAIRDVYEQDLKDVNEYIRDAEETAKAEPNNEEAQQYLMNAYEQKNVMYQLALDRSQP